MGLLRVFAFARLSSETAPKQMATTSAQVLVLLALSRHARSLDASPAIHYNDVKRLLLQHRRADRNDEDLDKSVRHHLGDVAERAAQPRNASPSRRRRAAAAR
jgi:hypothetical protein